MTRMIIGDDLSPHFLDDEGSQQEKCDLCGKVMVDHDAHVVIGGPNGWSTEDEEGWVYNGHLSCIEATEGIEVEGGRIWYRRYFVDIRTLQEAVRPYERAEDVEDFDYDEWYGTSR